MVKQTGLGRSLSALMGNGAKYGSKTVASEDSSSGVDKNLLALDALIPGNFQPRRLFSDEDLSSLAESIDKNGVILPIIVRSIQSGQYEIIAGERRWRASKILGLATIPAVIRELSDKEALEFALIENIQRQDLTPLEEADGYLRLMNEFRYTQEDLAVRLGKSRSHIANHLRLLSLPAPIKELLHAGLLSMGHARALVNVEYAEAIAQKIVREGLSVRQVEKLVHKGNPKKTKAAKPSAVDHPIDPQENEIMQIAYGLSCNLGMPVSIEEQNNKGNVSVAFNSLIQLEKILQLLGRKI